jgi:hypothetical protein
MQHEKELEQIKVAANYFNPTGAFIAGGAITSVFTGQPIRDVDFYLKSKEAFIEAVAQAYDESFWCLAATDRAVTFARGSDIIQLMHFDFFPTAEAVFDAFDFTVCMGAYDLDTKEFIFHEEFMKHAAQRHLSFHSGTRYPYGSLLRVLKYQQRDYKISRSDLLRIGLSLQKVKIESWDDLAAAIGGQYGEKALIETDKPYSLDAAIDLYKNADITVPAASEEMPGNAYECLKKIGIEAEHLKHEKRVWSW